MLFVYLGLVPQYLSQVDPEDIQWLSLQGGRIRKVMQSLPAMGATTPAAPKYSVLVTYISGTEPVSHNLGEEDRGVRQRFICVTNIS